MLVAVFVAVAVMVGIAVAGKAPYRQVLTHGFVLDEFGHPYSKSAIERARREGKKIKYLPPDEVIGKYDLSSLDTLYFNAAALPVEHHARQLHRGVADPGRARTVASGPAQLALRPDMSPLRVGVVCPYDLSVPGGVQAQVLGLARYLEGQGDRAVVIGPGLPDHVHRRQAQAHGLPRLDREVEIPQDV